MICLQAALHKGLNLCLSMLCSNTAVEELHLPRPNSVYSPVSSSGSPIGTSSWAIDTASSPINGGRQNQDEGRQHSFLPETAPNGPRRLQLIDIASPGKQHQSTIISDAMNNLYPLLVRPRNQKLVLIALFAQTNQQYRPHLLYG